MAMDGKESNKCRTLPDELVERIISKMPFPHIFKARCLSKSWLAKFVVTSRQDDKLKELREAASSFQRQVRERCKSWESLCPIVSRDEQCFGYKKSVQAWQKMPSLSFVPKRFRDSAELRMEGAFVYMCTAWGIFGQNWYVGNIFARSWKRIRACPYTNGSVLSVQLVTAASSETYKLILCCPEWDESRPEGGSFKFLIIYAIYDSESRSWRRMDFGRSDVNFHYSYRSMVNSVYHNGFVYTIVGLNSVPTLWALHAEEETLQEIILGRPFDWTLNSYNRASFVGVSQSSECMLSVFVDTGAELFSVDLESKTLSRLTSDGPHDLDGDVEGNRPRSDDSYMYFGVDCLSGRVKAFNLEMSVKKRQNRKGWCSVPGPIDGDDDYIFSWHSGSFEPGVGTFTKV